MLRFGIISNPFAKMNKKHPEHNTQMWYTLANEGLYKVTHSLSELEKVCQEFCARKINLVGIVGGDGSIGLVLSYLFRAYNNSEQGLPKILLLKGGTINFLAANLGIQTPALTCLNDTLFFIKKNLPLYETPVRTIDVNGRIGFVFAGGFATTFLEEYYKNKTNSAGVAISISKYVVDGVFAGKINGSFKKLLKLQQLKIKTVPTPLWRDKPLPDNKEEYTLIFASTVPRLPFNINLFTKIALRDQLAEIIVIAEKGKALIKGMMKAAIGGDINSFKGVDSVIFDTAEIQSESKLTYSLDGDLCTAENGKIDIKYGPSFIFCSPYYISDNDVLIQRKSSESK